MTEEERFQKDFNEVENMTAVCTFNSSWPRGEYPELKVGETYNVSHIGVFRSCTLIILEGFGRKEYNSACFDLFEDDKPLGRYYTREFRFLAPYLREMIRQSNPFAYEESLKEDAIRAELRAIEKEHDIKVLLAVQTGSRAMGLASPNSDWDVSYLYVHKPDWYSREGEHPCVIEQVCEGDVDTYGWELRDALEHLNAGNPTILEWLNSTPYYIIDESFSKRVQEIRKGFFSPANAIAYYNQIYNKYNERFLNQEGNLKTFLYYLRGVLACRWIETKGTMPTMFFGSLVDSTVEDDGIRAKVYALIKSKRKGENPDNVTVDAELIDFARHLAEHYDIVINSSQQDTVQHGAEKIDDFIAEYSSGIHSGR